MADDFRRAQLAHTSPGCGIKCPYCCGSKTWSTGQARAKLKQNDLRDWKATVDQAVNSPEHQRVVRDLEPSFYF